MSGSKGSVFHSWTHEQVRYVVQLVVKHGIADKWSRIAREHNHHFNIHPGRSEKAIKGMFSRVKDGFTAMQDPELVTMMEENKSLFIKTPVGRVTKSEERMDKMEEMMLAIMDKLTKPEIAS